MRTTSRFAAVFASSALAASMMVGGAGMAQAQGSADLLGSLMPDAPDVGLTVATDEAAVGGVVTNNTEATLECDVSAADADLVAQVQALVDEGESLEDALVESEFSDGNSDTTEVTADAGDEGEWSVEDIEVDDAFTAGAIADCDDDGEPVFAYEDSGLLGSLDFGGSLES